MTALPAVNSVSVAAVERAAQGLAQVSTSLDDLTREALEVLLWSYTTEADLTPVGHRMLVTECIKHACNRLRFLNARATGDLGKRSDPRCLVVITGLPRTASTYLHRLLAQDPDSWTLTLAQALEPFADAPTALTSAERYLKTFEETASLTLSLHPMGATLAEECVFLQQMTAVSHRFEITARVPTYAEWRRELRKHDTRPLWDHLVMVSHLSAGAERVVLKAPAYLTEIPMLQDHVGASLRVVVLQRSAARSLTSYSQMLHTVRSGFSNSSILRHVAREVDESWSRAWADFVEARASGLITAPIFDVAFDELIDSPARVLRLLYEWLDWPRDRIASMTY